MSETTKKKSVVKKAFMCDIAFDNELVNDNAGSIPVWGSANAFRKRSECADECGIYEVEIRFKRVVRKNKRWDA